MGNDYIVNPDAQQGESTIRKGSRNPANQDATTGPREAMPDDLEDTEATGETKLERHHHDEGKFIDPAGSMSKPLRKP